MNFSMKNKFWNPLPTSLEITDKCQISQWLHENNKLYAIILHNFETYLIGKTPVREKKE